MQTWRRTFATSVARLGHSATASTRPAVLRCVQILQASKKAGPCSLEDQEIKVNGFIRSVRKQKRFAFAEISDGSTVEPLQAILKPAQAAKYGSSFADATTPSTRLLSTRANAIISSSSLSTGAAVEISGVWKACPPGKEQSHELQTTDVTLVGASDPEVSVTATRIEGNQQPDNDFSIADLSNPEKVS